MPPADTATSASRPKCPRCQGRLTYQRAYLPTSPSETITCADCGHDAYEIRRVVRYRPPNPVPEGKRLPPKAKPKRGTEPRYQRRRDAGLCNSCAQPALQSEAYCLRHKTAQRANYRRRQELRHAACQLAPDEPPSAAA